MEEDLETLKGETKKLYESIGQQYCPYFSARITFNYLGWDHLNFKNQTRVRNVDDQMTRLRLFKYAPEIIKKSGTLQGIRVIDEWERVKSHGKWVQKLQKVNYYEFIAVQHTYRIKVIIKEVDGRERIFWSIIPAWSLNKNTMQRILTDRL